MTMAIVINTDGGDKMGEYRHLAKGKYQIKSSFEKACKILDLSKFEQVTEKLDGVLYDVLICNHMPSEAGAISIYFPQDEKNDSCILRLDDKYVDGRIFFNPKDAIFIEGGKGGNHLSLRSERGGFDVSV